MNLHIYAHSFHILLFAYYIVGEYASSDTTKEEFILMSTLAPLMATLKMNTWVVYL